MHFILRPAVIPKSAPLAVLTGAALGTLIGLPTTFAASRAHAAHPRL